MTVDGARFKWPLTVEQVLKLSRETIKQSEQSSNLNAAR
jgi:hypothetical protein